MVMKLAKTYIESASSMNEKSKVENHDVKTPHALRKVFVSQFFNKGENADEKTKERVSLLKQTALVDEKEKSLLHFTTYDKETKKPKVPGSRLNYLTLVFIPNTKVWPTPSQIFISLFAINREKSEFEMDGQVIVPYFYKSMLYAASSTTYEGVEYRGFKPLWGFAAGDKFQFDKEHLRMGLIFPQQLTIGNGYDDTIKNSGEYIKINLYKTVKDLYDEVDSEDEENIPIPFDPIETIFSNLIPVSYFTPQDVDYRRILKNEASKKVVSKTLAMLGLKKRDAKEI